MADRYGIDSATKLCLLLSGTDGQTTFLDSSTFGNTITNQGSPEIDTDQGKFDGGCFHAPDGDSYLSIPDHDDFHLSGDFTIDFWINLNSNSTTQAIYMQNSGSSANEFLFEFVGSSSFLRLLVDNGSKISKTWSWSPSTGTWYHVALCRSGNNWRCFVDGSEIGTTLSSSATIDNETGTVYIGAYDGSSSKIRADLDEFRISNSARYTSNFTPKTSVYTSTSGENDSNTVLLLSFDNIDDNSATATDTSVGGSTHTITVTQGASIGIGVVTKVGAKFDIGSSLRLDGSSFLNVTDNSEFTIGTNDFTIDQWIMLNTKSADFGIWEHRQDDNNYIRLWWDQSSTTLKFRVVQGGSTVGSYDYVIDFDLYRWYHLEVTRDSGTVYIFVDGTDISATVNTDLSTTSVSDFNAVFHVGKAKNVRIDGWMRSFRLSVGISRHNQNFTPPYSDFTTDDGDDQLQSLLLHMEGSDASTTIQDTSSNFHTVTANGDAQIDTAQRKFGSASCLFDGTGDYLTIPDDDSFYLEQNWTIQCWVRFNDVSGEQLFYHQRTTTNTNETYLSFQGGTPALVFQIDNGTYTKTWPWSPSVNTWYHVAVCRDKDNFYAFIDGQMIGTPGKNGTDLDDESDDVNIGRKSDGSGYFDGWLDEFIVHKDRCVYHENFIVKNTAYTDPPQPGDVAFSLPMFTITSGTGMTGDITMPIFEVDAIRQVLVGGITLPIQQVNGVMQIHNASFNLILPTVSGHVQNTFGTITLPMFTVDAQRYVTSESSLSLPMLELTASLVQGVSMDGDMSLPAPLTLDARTGHNSKITLPMFTFSISGTGAETMSFNKKLPMFTVSATHKQTGKHTGSLDMLMFEVSATLIGGNSSTGSFTIPLFTLLGKTKHSFPADVSFNIPQLTVQGVLTHGENGDVSVTLPSLEFDIYLDNYKNRVI